MAERSLQLVNAYWRLQATLPVCDECVLVATKNRMLAIALELRWLGIPGW